MSEQSLKEKTVKGTIWSAVEAFSRIGVSFLVSIVLARLLGPEEYGLIGILTIFINVFNAIIDSGFTNALIRKKDVSNTDYSTIFYANLLVSIVLMVALFFGANALAIFFERPELATLTKAMSVILLINGLAIVQRARLTKAIDFKSQTKISLLSSIVSGVFGIAMAYCGFGVWALVAQQVSCQLLITILLWYYSKWMPLLVFSWNSFRELWGFGWKLLVSKLLEAVWNESYQVIIGKYYTPAALGYYTRAQQFSSLFSTNLTMIVNRVSFPVLSSIQDDKERLKGIYQKVIRVTMFISFIAMINLAAVSKPSILFLLGDKWSECIPMLQIVSLGMMLYPLHAINLNMLQVQGRSDLYLKLEIIKKLLAIAPLALGVFCGIYYMLWGSVVLSFIGFYLNAYYSGRFINYSFSQQVKDLIPSLAVAIAMAIPIYLISLFIKNPFICLSVQTLLGAIILLVIGESFNIYEYKEIKEIIKDKIK